MTEPTRTSPRPTPPRASSPSSSPSLPPDEYEFSEAHKEVFASLAASMSFVGVCEMLVGVMSVVFALGAGYGGFLGVAVGLLVGAAICLPLGWWMTAAGRSLSALVRTRGRDIARLMEAVVQLRRLFGFARIFVILYAIAAMVAGALFVWCNFAADKGGRCFAGFG
jgi:hypothetical protein